MHKLSTRWARILSHIIIASTLAIVFAHYGSLARFERALSDVLTFGASHPASGNVILVVTDPSTIEATGRFPLDRSLLTHAIERLKEAGAERIYIDAALNSAESPQDDGALANALTNGARPPIALPLSQSEWNPASAATWRTPLAAFSAATNLVGTNYVTEVDRRTRSQTALSPDAPLAADWLAGRTEVRATPLHVDFSIDAASLPRYEIRAVAGGSVPASAFAGKRIIVGFDIPAPSQRVQVPLQGNISRTHFLALGAETVLSGEPYRRPSGPVSAAIVFGLVAATGLAIASLRTFAALAIVLGVSAAWLYFLPGMQRETGLLLPTLSVPMALMIVWQTLLFRESALASAIHKRLVRFMGVGRQALIAAVDVMAEPAFIIDGRFNIVGSNAPFRAITGQLAGDATGSGLVAGLIDRGHLAQCIARDDDQPARLECSAQLRDGSERFFEINLRWVQTPSGPLAIAGLSDVTEARERERQLKALAFNDALTGLANRVSFNAALQRTAATAPESRFGLLLIDLDGFKAVNDTLGHHAGDLLLQGFAQRLSGLLGTADVAARLGGDEFAVLQTGGDRESTIALAGRLLDAVAEPFDIEGASAKIGASIGIALFPEHDGEADEVVKLADAAMYLAKASKPGYAIHTANGPRLLRSDRPAKSSAA